MMCGKEVIILLIILSSHHGTIRLDLAFGVYRNGFFVYLSFERTSKKKREHYLRF
ncbi:hypothetical protein PR001_g25507 [Phytophthora rubi]|uniref:RxLR effector protein n=1 Tax=Phytophthora rubi TaxID=129364 RepID=A0A6A3I1N1_9STRA|nr:hypothetical protein PR001_g25507 [Phytophthora rubi]